MGNEIKHTPCNEFLSDPDGFCACCKQEYGTEHDHSDKTARDAVEAGLAVAYVTQPSIQANS